MAAQVPANAAQAPATRFPAKRKVVPEEGKVFTVEGKVFTAEGKGVPADCTIASCQMHGHAILSSTFELAAQGLNSYPSLESQTTQHYEPRASTSSAGDLYFGSTGLTPVANGKKVTKMPGTLQGSPSLKPCGCFNQYLAAAFT